MPSTLPSRLGVLVGSRERAPRLEVVAERRLGARPDLRLVAGSSSDDLEGDARGADRRNPEAAPPDCRVVVTRPRQFDQGRRVRAGRKSWSGRKGELLAAEAHLPRLARRPVLDGELRPRDGVAYQSRDDAPMLDAGRIVVNRQEERAGV
jgi:hypothetical protein